MTLPVRLSPWSGGGFAFLRLPMLSRGRTQKEGRRQKGDAPAATMTRARMRACITVGRLRHAPGDAAQRREPGINVPSVASLSVSFGFVVGGGSLPTPRNESKHTGQEGGCHP